MRKSEMAAVHRKRGGGRKIAYAIAAIIIIAIAATYLVGASNSVPTVSSSQQLSLSMNGTEYFSLPGNSSINVLFLSHSSDSGITLYLTQTPVMAKPIQAISLSRLQSVNASTADTQTADIQIKLLSSNSSAATLSITPVPAGLAIGAQQFPLVENGGEAYSSTTTVQTTTVQSGSQGSTTTASSTSVATTAATTAQSIPTAQIMTVINGSSIGQLLTNFNSLYVQDKACTQSQYNSSYVYYYKSAPSGPYTYYNVSPETPTGFTITIAGTGTDLYNATYAINLPSAPAAQKIVAVQVSTSTYSVVSYKFLSPGLNLSTFTNTYNFQSSVSGDCGAYISPT